jgi:hypothetical protein
MSLHQACKTLAAIGEGTGGFVVHYIEIREAKTEIPANETG